MLSLISLVIFIAMIFFITIFMLLLCYDMQYISILFHSMLLISP